MHFFCSALIPPPHSAAGSATFWFSRDFYLNRCLEQKAMIKKGRRVKVVPDSCLDALRFFCLKETENVNYSIRVDNYIHISFFLNIHLFLPGFASTSPRVWALHTWLSSRLIHLSSSIKDGAIFLLYSVSSPAMWCGWTLGLLRLYITGGPQFPVKPVVCEEVKKEPHGCLMPLESRYFSFEFSLTPSGLSCSYI